MLSKAEFDLLKLLLLIWFLAPIGYNASDMIFNLVGGTHQKYVAEHKSGEGGHLYFALMKLTH